MKSKRPLHTIYWSPEPHICRLCKFPLALNTRKTRHIAGNRTSQISPVPKCSHYKKIQNLHEMGPIPILYESAIFTCLLSTKNGQSDKTVNFLLKPQRFSKKILLLGELCQQIWEPNRFLLSKLSSSSQAGAWLIWLTPSSIISIFFRCQRKFCQVPELIISDSTKIFDVIQDM